MQLQQNVRQAVRPECQMMMRASCDFGIEPFPTAGLSLNFRLHDDGLIYPVITLTNRGAVFTAQYHEGFAPDAIRSGDETVTAALRQAKVEFTQEDPTCPEVVVSIRCGASERVEETFVTEQLWPYMDFWFEYGAGADEDEEVDADEEFDL